MGNDILLVFTIKSYINAFLLDLAQLCSQTRHLTGHARSAILLNSQIELLLEMIVQSGVQRVPLTNFTCSVRFNKLSLFSLH